MSEKNSVKDSIVERAEKIYKLMSADDAGTVSGDITSVYEEYLPEGLNMEAVKAISNHNADHVAATTKAFGKLAVETLKSNKKLESVSGTFNYGYRDSVKLRTDRKSEMTNPFGENKGETITKFGSTTVRVRTKAGSNSGQLAAVRSEINEIAAKALK